MSSSRIAPPFAILVVLVFGAVTLVVVELANGAARDVSPAVTSPCQARQPFQGHGVDATIQRLVLEGLDGAACKLGTTREELVLSLSPSSSRSPRRDRHTIEIAVRAGLTHAIDAEERQGNIPALLASLLHRLVQTTPLERLIQGGLSLGLR